MLITPRTIEQWVTVKKKKNFFKYTFVIHIWIALTKLIYDLKTICSKCTIQKIWGVENMTNQGVSLAKIMQMRNFLINENKNCTSFCYILKCLYLDFISKVIIPKILQIAGFIETERTFRLPPDLCTTYHIYMRTTRNSTPESI